MEQRYGGADHRPYALPERLADLAGPRHGMVALPARIGWSGRRQYDLDDPMDVGVLYERVIVEPPDAEALRRLLNAGRVQSVWKRLFLPRQVRLLWETRFPEFAKAA